MRRQAIENAKRQFEQAVMDGRLPSDDVLAVLEDCHSEIPVNVKEATEELLDGRCSMYEMEWATPWLAFANISAPNRVPRRKPSEASGSRRRAVSQSEAWELLGVTAGCSPEELMAAYRRKMSQWHPDKLNSMADELKAFATRRTARINEAYQKLR